MSFLLKSDLKKHLSSRSGRLSSRDDIPVTQTSRVILLNGNLITLPSSVSEEEQALAIPEVNGK